MELSICSGRSEFATSSCGQYVFSAARQAAPNASRQVALVRAAERALDWLLTDETRHRGTLHHNDRRTFSVNGRQYVRVTANHAPFTFALPE